MKNEYQFGDKMGGKSINLVTKWAWKYRPIRDCRSLKDTYRYLIEGERGIFSNSLFPFMRKTKNNRGMQGAKLTRSY